MLSHALNIGLLLPGEVCDAVEEAYRGGRVPLASAEGFLRQVMGWREYVWGLYWRWMPEWRSMNELDSRRPVAPAFTRIAAPHARGLGRPPQRRGRPCLVGLVKPSGTANGAVGRPRSPCGSPAAR